MTLKDYKQKKEEWRPVVGYEGFYEISSLGNVRGLRRRGCHGRNLKACTEQRNKYLHVVLFKNQTGKMFLVHRLVAKAFLANPHSYKVVNHIDENGKNNEVSNLEWCTQSYNVKTFWARNGRIHPLSKSVRQIKDGKVLKIFNSILEASKKIGISHANISRCCHKQRSFKSAGGFQWEYV